MCDRDQGGGVVVDDGSLAAVAHDRGVGRVAKVYEERLGVGFIEQVAPHLDRDGSLLVAGGNHEGAVRGLVVGVRRGGSVGRRVIDQDIGPGELAELDREIRVAESRIKFEHGHVFDPREGRDLVVHDRGDAASVHDGGVDRVVQVEEEVFRGAFVQRVPEDPDGDPAVCRPGRDHEQTVGSAEIVHGRRGAVGRGEVHGDLVRADVAQANGEGDAGDTGISLQHGHVVNAHERRIVDDRAPPPGVEQDGVRGVAEVDEEVFRNALPDNVPDHQHGHGARDAPGRDDHGAVRRQVVAAGGRGPVGGLVVDAHVELGRRIQRDGKHGRGGADFAFGHDDVVDAHQRRVVVVDDRAFARSPGDDCVRGAGQQKQELLEIPFVGEVADHGHRDRALRVAFRNDERPVRGGVVGGRRGGVVRRCEHHRDVRSRGGAHADGEHGIGRARIAFEHEHAVDRKQGLVVVVDDLSFRVPVGHDDGADGVMQLEGERLEGSLVERIAQDRDVDRAGRESRADDRGSVRVQVVLPGPGRSVGREEIDPGIDSRRGAEREGKDHGVGPRVPFHGGRVACPGERRGFILQDRSDPGGVRDGAVGRSGQVDVEGFGQPLVQRVPADQDGEGPVRLSRGEDEGPVGREVVPGGHGRIVGRLEVHAHVQDALERHRDREHHGRVPDIDLEDRRIVDRELRFVVIGDGDVARVDVSRELAVGRVADIDVELFEDAFVENVTDNGDRKRGADGARRNGHGPVRTDIVKAGFRRPVGRHVVHGDVQPAGFAELDGDENVRFPGIALDDRCVPGRDEGRVVVVEDPAPRFVVGNRGVHGVAEENVEIFERPLVDIVAVNDHVDHAGEGALGDRQRPVRRDVVGGRDGRAVGRRKIDPDDHARVRVHFHRQLGRRDRALVRFENVGVLDPHQRGRVVVDDGAGRHRVGRHAIHRVAQHDVEHLAGGLEQCFAEDLDGDGSVRLPRGDGHGPVRGEVVRRGHGRPVGRFVVHVDIGRDRPAQEDVEKGIGCSLVSLGERRVRDPQFGSRLVFDDRGRAGTLRKHGVGDVPEPHVEFLGGPFKVQVGQHGHGQGSRGLAGEKGEGPVGRDVVVAGGRRAVGRAEVERRRQRAFDVQGHGEHHRRGSRVAFRDARVVDRDGRGRFVLQDGSRPELVRDGGIGRVADDQVEGLGGSLVHEVPEDLGGHQGVRVSRRDRQRSVGSRVVGAGRRGAVGRFVVRRDCDARVRAQDHVERRLGGFHVGFGHEHRHHAQEGFRVVIRDEAHRPVRVDHAVRDVREVHVERLSRALVEDVPIDRHGDHVTRLAGGEEDGPVGRDIVHAGLGGGVGRLVVHGEIEDAFGVEGDLEHHRRGSFVPFRHGGSLDRHLGGRFVVGDRSLAGCIGQRGVGGIGEVHEEVLGERLEDRVAEDGHIDEGVRVSGGDGDRAVG